MNNILQRHNIPDDGAAASVASCPAKPFFLEETYIRKYWSTACLPEDKLPETIEFAAALKAVPRFRHLAWHLYRYCNLTPIASFKGDDLPDIIDEFGIKSGLFYILVALSLIPSFIERAQREGFPLEYGAAGAKRIGTTTCFFAQEHDGAFGLRGNTITFLLHYRETATWRIGRFDFQPRIADNNMPVVYGKDDKIIAFLPDKVLIDSNGNRTDEPEKAVIETFFSQKDECVTGMMIDPDTGLINTETTSIDLREGWKKLAGPGDWTLFFHIPGGGSMTPEKCRDSFVEALQFFHDYAPEKEFRLIWSSSWIFNPAWTDLLPESNLAKLIKSGHLFPTLQWEKIPGLYFVFGKKDGKPENFTPQNSMERAMIKCWQEKRLRPAGFFILPETLKR